MPRSGVPGCTGERYDWDRGFSEELEGEGGCMESQEISDLPSSASGRKPAIAKPRLAGTYQAARTA